MQYPRLVPPKLCTAEVRVVFLGGVDIEGREAVLTTYCGRCNLQQKTKQVLTADKRLVTLEAVALFDGDIAPYLPQPKGLLYLRGCTRWTAKTGTSSRPSRKSPSRFRRKAHSTAFFASQRSVIPTAPSITHAWFSTR